VRIEMDLKQSEAITTRGREKENWVPVEYLRQTPRSHALMREYYDARTKREARRCVMVRGKRRRLTLEVPSERVDCRSV
jgi:hypothetical protein